MSVKLSRNMISIYERVFNSTTKVQLQDDNVTGAKIVFVCFENNNLVDTVVLLPETVWSYGNLYPEATNTATVDHGWITLAPTTGWTCVKLIAIKQEV